MTRVVIVGEIYNADLSIGGGPMPGGPPGGRPSGRTRSYNPAYPGRVPIYETPPPRHLGRPAASRSRPGPARRRPGNGGTPVPEDVYTPAPIPEEIASQYVVSVYNPKTMGWTTKSYPPR